MTSQAINPNARLSHRHPVGVRPREKSSWSRIAIFSVCIAIFLVAINLVGRNTSIVAGVAPVLIILSLSRTIFWLTIVPVLICMTGLEMTVLLDRSSQISSIRSSGLFGDLWLWCSAVRATAFCLRRQTVPLPRQYLHVIIALIVILLSASVIFSAKYGGIEGVNKEPIKFLIFVFVGGLLLSEVDLHSMYTDVWRGLATSAILGVAQRVFLAVVEETKNPGIYTYTGIFICTAMIWLAHKDSFGNKAARSAFWLILLIAHLSPSRTEIALALLASGLLIYSLSVRAVPITIIALLAAYVASNFLPETVALYFQHKLNFFHAVGSGADIGDSASVRVAEFLNLVNGRDTDAFNLAFGRGFFGFIEFSGHPSASVFSESSFTDHQYKTNMFYQLHFFLTEILFFGGFVGLCIYLIIVARIYLRARVSVELVLLTYFALNIMFRTELVLIVPPILAGFREICRNSTATTRRGS